MKIRKPTLAIGSRLAYLVAFLIVLALVMILLSDRMEVLECIEKVILALIGAFTSIAIQTLRSVAKVQHASAMKKASRNSSCRTKKSKRQSRRKKD
jgi:hypothetical protein